jgi:hypothetical protein
MRKYQIVRPGAIVLAVTCLGMCTGLAVEKVLKDGISSYTLLASMLVLPAAVGMLLHQGWEDVRDGKLMRAPTAFVLAMLCLAVTLPASIGSSGGARDTALAEAKASNRAIEIAEGAYTESQRDLNTVKAGVLKECVGAPPVIIDDSWPKCRWFRRAVEAYEAKMSTSGKQLVSAPAVKIADSGEQRVAWAASAVASRWGYQVTAADVSLVWPMLPPVCFELLAAFFLAAGLERRGTHQKIESAQVVIAETAPVETHPVKIEQITAGEYADMVSPVPPTPPKTKKRSKRQQKRARGVAWVRAYREKHGKAPSFRVVKNVLQVPPATASRWRRQALAA